jgi:signal transduction histidine kinase
MGRILVVDDDASSRSLVGAFLEGSGHELIEASTGERALEICAEDLPDIVLLDVILPGLHGFEVARRLKEMAGVEPLPIMLITGLTDQSSRVLGFRSGVDDCLVKPFDRIELRARVENLLARRSAQVAIAAKNAELLEQQNFKDELATMVVHDLKNPLAVVLSNLDFALETLGPASDEGVLGALSDSRIAAHRALRMVGNLLDVARIEANRLELHRETFEAGALLSDLLAPREGVARTNEVTFELRAPEPVQLTADLDMIARVIENVLDNALRYTPSGGKVVVSVVPREGRVEIRMGNTGPAIPPEMHKVIFEKFGQGKGAQRMNLGLGMYFCRLAAEAHGGRIWIESEPELPTVFVLELLR